MANKSQLTGANLAEYWTGIEGNMGRGAKQNIKE